MKRQKKYFINFDARQDKYFIRSSCYWSINDFGYYNMQGRLYSPKNNMIFDSIDDAIKELEKVSKLIEEVDLDD